MADERVSISAEDAAREWAESVGIPLMDDEHASLAALIREREAAAHNAGCRVQLHFSNEYIRQARTEHSAELASLRAERDELRDKVERLRCQQSTEHSWDGDGQCLRCREYATDLLSRLTRQRSGNVRSE